MGENRSLLTALGSILGLVLFIFVIMQAVSYFKEGTAEFDEMQRQAGAPILLSETLHENTEAAEESATEEEQSEGEAAAEGEAASEEAAGEVAVDATTDVTTTNALTETGTITATEAVTTGEVISPTTAGDTVVEASEVLTETDAVDSAAALTATESMTVTESMTGTDDLSETTAVTTTEALTEGVATEEEAAPAEEAPAEEAAPEEEAPAEVALVVPTPDEVAPIFTKAGCIGCHVIPDIPGAVGAVGPDLTEIGTTAATRVEGLNVQEYLYQSILEPNEFIVPECPTGPCLPGLMVQNLGDVLTPEEIDAVVGYLSSLTSE